MIVAHGGFVLVFLNPYSVLALLLLIGSVVALRIPLEERTLMGSVEYAEYARNRDRLLPGLW
ncbi:hypothetical protein [Allosalinactinospora lopnorensis]|uniref:hypothetical protein n=1 Tax=Allosalinactinospora lopnorensis TaxID=1352348 RepID=UPI0006979F03|nr:hypothetical protein [Allosalinactinospora lopnorensis]